MKVILKRITQQSMRMSQKQKARVLIKEAPKIKRVKGEKHQRKMKKASKRRFRKEILWALRVLDLVSRTK